MNKITDKNLALKVVNNNGLYLEMIDSKLLLENPDIIKAAINQNPEAINFIDSLYYEADDYKPYVKQAEKKGLSLDKLSSRIIGVCKLGNKVPCIEDKTAALDILSKDGNMLEFCSEELKDNKEVVMAALTNYPYAFEFASCRLKYDFDVLKCALNLPPYQNFEGQSWYEIFGRNSCRNILNVLFLIDYNRALDLCCKVINNIDSGDINNFVNFIDDQFAESGKKAKPYIMYKPPFENKQFLSEAVLSGMNFSTIERGGKYFYEKLFSDSEKSQNRDFAFTINEMAILHFLEKCDEENTVDYYVNKALTLNPESYDYIPVKNKKKKEYVYLVLGYAAKSVYGPGFDKIFDKKVYSTLKDFPSFKALCEKLSDIEPNYKEWKFSTFKKAIKEVIIPDDSSLYTFGKELGKQEVETYYNDFKTNHYIYDKSELANYIKDKNHY